MFYQTFQIITIFIINAYNKFQFDSVILNVLFLK
jgi:hypothetical protein